MKPFMEYTAHRIEVLANSPFLRWLDADRVALDRKLDFMPILVLFAMGATEDATRSHWFLDDWEALRMDEKLGWSAGDTLAWLFVAPELEPFRRDQIQHARLMIEHAEDPTLQLARTKATEAVDQVFLQRVVDLATQLAQVSGQTYRYFGSTRLAREPATDEAFDPPSLDPVQRAATLALVQRLFDRFEGMFATFESYVSIYVEPDAPPTPSAVLTLPRTPLETLPPTGRHREPDPSAVALAAHLAARMTKAEAHSFYAWLRRAPHPAIDKLRGFLPLWVLDVLGYRDLHCDVFWYRKASNDLEQLINVWVNDLETHSLLFLADWRALSMDAVLGWSARDTLAFCFLDPVMAARRQHIEQLVALGLRHADPVLRFWLMKALESSGEAFFATTRRLALLVESAGLGPLDYLGNRHALAHPDPDRPIDMLRSRFFAEPLDKASATLARHMVDVVFDALEAQLDHSLHAVQTNRFDIPGLSSTTVLSSSA